MDYLGLFCLGAFTGTIATFGMTHVTSLKGWQTVLALSLPAVLSGAAMVMIDRFAASPAFGCYPAGLVAALVWAFASDSIRLITGGGIWARVIGSLHLLIASGVTLILAAIAAVPAFLQIRAELDVPADARWVLMLKRHVEATKPVASPAPPGSAKPSPASGP